MGRWAVDVNEVMWKIRMHGCGLQRLSENPTCDFLVLPWL